MVVVAPRFETMNHCVLIVEDEAAVAQFVERGLKECGYTVRLAGTGEEALEILAAEPVDLIVLDLLLPGISGLEVVREVRQSLGRVPVLALTARSGLAERVEGLEAGLDDYLPKPFAFAELVARLRVLQRRLAVERPLMTYHDLTLDIYRRVASRGERLIRLTNKEYELLKVLMHSAGSVVNRSVLIQELWSNSERTPPNLLDIQVSMLRRKLDGPAEVKLLHTIRGIGYMLRDSE